MDNLSSPCKKIKLTPRKRQAESLRQTQESKITSTPQRASEKILSPNISRISSSTCNRSVRTRLSDAFSSSNNHENVSFGTNNNDNEHGEKSARSTPTTKSGSEKSVGSSHDYDEYLDDFGRIKHTGNIWKIYKPLQEGTLYAQLSQEPQNAQEVVTELLLLYNRKPEIAVCSLLKLCTDLCGYQNFNISEHYHFRENAAGNIIKLMESDDVLGKETLKMTGRYLFMESRTQLAKILKISVYNFVQKLILCGHERRILYDEFFSKHFFLFIKAMSFSEIRAIRHTGVIIAIKVLSALVMVYNKIINDENYSSEEVMNTSSENVLYVQKQDINMFLEFFYFIFVKNCRLQDNKVTLMRVECIHELSTWIKYFPKIFITQLQAFTYLCKLITDASKDVRYAALETFEALVQAPNVLPVLKTFMPDFAEAIGRRFYDIDNKVAIKAIDIFTIFLKREESLITTNRFKLLMNLVFDKSFVIGESAARFLTCYLQSEENDYKILIQLAKFSMKPGYARKQLLVEGCLHNCTALQNWKIYIDLLSHDNVEMDVKQALSEIFSESAYQTLEGHSSIMREMSPKVTNIDPAEYMKIAKYLPRLNGLLKKYRDNPSILIEFLKIISSLSKDILNENYCQHYMEICDTMEVLFYHHNDEKLLTKLVETFQHFCNITHFAKRAKSVAESICSKHANDLLASLTNEDHPETLMKVAILFAHFNLTKYFSWESLFDSWSETDEAKTANLLSCCMWYLIWSLKNLTDSTYPLKSDLQKQFPLLSRTCKEYVSTCFNMLQHLRGQPLHFKAYDSLCHLHVTYMKELEGPIKVLKRFEELKLTVDDNQLQMLLVAFVDKYVVSNPRMSLHDRRVYVVKYVDLVHHNVLPTKCLVHIFKYYYTYIEEFGPIIESSLNAMAVSTDENVLLMMVVYTITIVYENILNKYGAVDMRTEEVKHIKLLLKQFLTFKVFKSPNRSFKKLLYFAFNYSFKDESKYTFLYLVKYFVDILVDEDKKEVFDFFKKKIPKNAEKNPAVLYIANYMKNLKAVVAKKGGPKKIVNKENKKPTKNTKNSHKQVLAKASKKNTKNIKNNIENVSKKRNTDAGKTQKVLNVDSETEVSEDDLTIHDSESDDMEQSSLTQ